MGKSALSWVARVCKVRYDVDESMSMLACGVDASRTERVDEVFVVMRPRVDQRHRLGICVLVHQSD